MAPRWSETDAWTVDQEPLLDLATSGTGSPHEFFRVPDATRLSGGAIVVADGGSGEIRYFSNEGTFLQAVGRRGEGPGEFRDLNTIDRFRGDSLIAWDFGLRRASILGPEREVSRLISSFAAGVRMLDLRPLHDSAFVGIQSPTGPAMPPPGLFQMSEAIVTVTGAGSLIDTLTLIPGLEFIRSETDAMVGVALYAKDGHYTVFGGKVYAGSADSMQFQTYSATGVMERIARVPGYDLELSGEDIRAERDALLEGNFPPSYRELVASMPEPSTRPAYSDLVVDSEGYAWAAEHHSMAERGSATDWEVFAPDGEWLGSVRTPARFTVFEIGQDYVLGIRLDELDVEHVQLLRLNRGAGD
jgi:hypothetical protein